jgi:hypothetical protein
VLADEQQEAQRCEKMMGTISILSVEIPENLVNILTFAGLTLVPQSEFEAGSVLKLLHVSSHCGIT